MKFSRVNHFMFWILCLGTARDKKVSLVKCPGSVKTTWGHFKADTPYSDIMFLSEDSESCLSSVQSLNRVRLLAAPWTAAPQAPVHCQLLEFTQTHVHRVGDAIQPSHPLSSPSPAFHLSQHQGLFQWVSSWHQVAKALELQLQHQSFQWRFRTDFL